jgi:hypothetical protein
MKSNQTPPMVGPINLKLLVKYFGYQLVLSANDMISVYIFDHRPVSRNRPILVKFVDPYLGHWLTKKSEILVLKVFHSGLSPYQISTKSEMVMHDDCVDLTWNSPII